MFIDPPEFVINLKPPPHDGTPYEISPDTNGQIVLTVKVRHHAALPSYHPAVLPSYHPTILPSYIPPL